MSHVVLPSIAWPCRLGVPVNRTRRGEDVPEGLGFV